MPRPYEAMFEALRAFRQSWPRRGWSYDSRVECVASAFDSEFAAEARVLIMKLLPGVWGHRTLPTAGPLISAIAARTGGIRASQMIFAGDRVGHITPFGLWWPWEEGTTISLRIGLDGGSTAEILELCNAFGAEP
jgi:hypothetical protein